MANEINILSNIRYPTEGQALNVAIEACTNAIGFKEYEEFLYRALCLCKNPVTCSNQDAPLKEVLNESTVFDFRGARSYNVLKIATELFLLLNNCGIVANCLECASEDDYSEKSLGRKLEIAELKEELKDYLADGISLPYIDMILDNLFLNGYLKDITEKLKEKRKVTSKKVPVETPAIRLQTGNAADIKERTQKPNIFCSEHVSKNPCLMELIWSYWHEEGMIVQTLNAISLRFQNRKTAIKDPLANLTIDPLRPLSNFLWGYIQDEQHRLTLQRRVYEYDHEYGLSLMGKAVPTLQSVDSRSKFLESFHNLLHKCLCFYKEENNKMIIPDAFPLLNALKEVHLLLAEGAHNQFRDLPFQARAEMLMQQWMLARPEMREFLGRRPMMPYTERWMAPVDAMKSLQGWTDVSVMHFHDLGVFGEKIILSIRYGNWNDVDNAEEARNWALYWRDRIQSYVHAYRTVTGVDLASPQVIGRRDLVAVKPSILLSRRLALQLSRGKAITKEIEEYEPVF